MKILFLRPEHIGDYGMGLPVLKALRKKFPDARIDVVVGPWNKNFAEATPYVDRVIVFDNPLIKRHLKYWEIVKFLFSKQLSEMIKFTKKMNEEDYDLLISISDRKFNRVLLKMFKAKKKILGTEIRNTGFDERKRIIDLFARYDIQVDDSKINLNYSEEDRKVVQRVLKKDSKFKKKIVIHPITPLEEKNWPIGKWRELIRSFEKDNYVFYALH